MVVFFLLWSKLVRPIDFILFHCLLWDPSPTSFDRLHHTIRLQLLPFTFVRFWKLRQTKWNNKTITTSLLQYDHLELLKSKLF